MQNGLVPGRNHLHEHPAMTGVMAGAIRAKWAMTVGGGVTATKADRTSARQAAAAAGVASQPTACATTDATTRAHRFALQTGRRCANG